MFQRIKINQQKGQSLLEVLLGLVVFVLVSTAILFLIMGTHRVNLQSKIKDQAIYINNEGLDAVRSISLRNWREMACQQSGLEIGSEGWQLGDADSTEILNDNFERQVGIFSVYRNTAGLIQDGPQSYNADLDQYVNNIFDPYIRRVVATTTWTLPYYNQTQSVSKESYLTITNLSNLYDDKDHGMDTGSDPRCPTNCETEYDISNEGVKLLTDTTGDLTLYKIKGDWISHPINTETIDPQYFFLRFDYEWVYYGEEENVWDVDL
jgi:type II secretory pathway pseudopilin PulG